MDEHGSMYTYFFSFFFLRVFPFPLLLFLASAVFPPRPGLLVFRRLFFPIPSHRDEHSLCPGCRFKLIVRPTPPPTPPFFPCSAASSPTLRLPSQTPPRHRTPSSRFCDIADWAADPGQAHLLIRPVGAPPVSTRPYLNHMRLPPPSRLFFLSFGSH